MSDTNEKGAKETVAEEVKALAKDLYGDVLRPAVAPIGRTLGSTVEVLLTPVDIVVGGLKAGADRLKVKLGLKLANVPPERQLAPPVTIAAPTTLNYAMLGDGDEVADLREMFENLLVASMDRATAHEAHPAFVQMIAQITPDEAWILKSIDRRRYALVTLFEQDENGATQTQSSLGFRTRLGLGIGIDESRQQQYLSNLERLGILKITTGIAADSDHEKLKENIEREFGERDLVLYGGSAEVTAIGWQFLNICVRGGSKQP